MTENITIVNNSAIGIDVGTHTIIVAYRNKDGKIEYKEDVNGFMEFAYNDQTKYLYQNMKMSGVPLFVLSDQKKFYAFGAKAKIFAYTMGSVLTGQASAVGDLFKRTMKDGILSTKDSKDSFNVLATMVHGLIKGCVDAKSLPIAFSVPGDPVSGGDSTRFHEGVIKKILESGTEYNVSPIAVNEANAIVLSECEKNGFTGIGISCGAGMTNVCFSVFGSPAFTFSIVGGGDFIDRGVSEKVGVDTVVANMIKMGDEDTEGVDLLSQPSGDDAHIKRTIIMYYDILIDNIATKFAEYVKRNFPSVSGIKNPPVYVAGGTASPNGFVEKLSDAIKSKDMGNFKIGPVVKCDNNLYTIAKGLLLQAERSTLD